MAVLFFLTLINAEIFLPLVSQINTVIPAQAGIYFTFLDSCLRRNDVLANLFY